MTTLPPPHACAACRVPLHFLTLDEHRLDLGEWIHDPRITDHAPQPVPREEVPDVRQICDFCATMDEPTWLYFTWDEIDTELIGLVPGEATETRITDEWMLKHFTREAAFALRSLSDAGWAACEQCAQVIDRGAFGRLVTHVKRSHNAAGLPSTRMMVADRLRCFWDDRAPGRFRLRDTSS